MLFCFLSVLFLDRGIDLVALHPVMAMTAAIIQS